MSEMGKQPSRLTRELLDLASDMKGAGLIDAAMHDKITLRHLKPDQASIVPVTPAEVKDMRMKARAGTRSRPTG